MYMCTSTFTSTPQRKAKWCAQCDESRIMFTYTVVSSCTHIPSVCVYVRYHTALYICISYRIHSILYFIHSYPCSLLHFSGYSFHSANVSTLIWKLFTERFSVSGGDRRNKKKLYGKNAKWTRIKMWKGVPRKLLPYSSMLSLFVRYFFKQSHTTLFIFFAFHFFSCLVHVFNHYHFV